MIYNFDELIFQILAVSRCFHRQGTFNIKGRPFAALAFRVSGTGDFEIDNISFTSNAGDILFVPEGVSYKVKYSGGESIFIHLSECNYTAAENISTDNPDFFYAKFSELINYWQELHCVNGAKAMVYNILRRIAEDKSAPIKDTNFMRCVSYIDENFCNPNLDNSHICRAGFISESSLRRKFHRYYNMSPKQYLLKLRLNKAMELLIEGRFSVKTVSEMCGFSDEKYFSRAIKSRYGQPPSAFCKNSGYKAF